ncbi:MAG: phosphonopyruvate decarboxylase [Desulfosporosinus sp.]|nr:phosphonopyruvate decarboxylase [Desulfosporosinus sp.]
MDVTKFIAQLRDIGVNFFTGVPDSRLKPLCNYLIHTYGISKHHIIAANEGNCTALASGYHLATGKIPCVYLQNSGLGNIINPVASLLNDQVYGIPCILIIGWRGEPGEKDEPQHAFQGKVTLELLEVMDIAFMVLDEDTTCQDLEDKLTEFQELLDSGKIVALVVKKGGLSYEGKVKYHNENRTPREEIIRHILDVVGEDIIVSTTGKTSRELFELREQNGQSHQNDFLTVGSMGHSSSIALGLALHKPDTKVWCIDGDGATLMHMGAMAVIGAMSPQNYVHVVVNNSAHESVGGMPTVAGNINFVQIALGCGYKMAYSASNLEELDKILERVQCQEGPIFMEVKSAIGSRGGLGRPTKTPSENKTAFMEYLRSVTQ